MDIGLFAGVVWRFRWIALAGFIVALVLAVLTTASVSFSGGPLLRYRTPAVYQADATVAVTQAGFPLGRTVFPGQGAPGPASSTSPYADPTRFSVLAETYAVLVSNDAIQSEVTHHNPLEVLSAQAVLGPNNDTLPFIDLTGLGSSPRQAIDVAVGGATALERYIKQQQVSARVPARQRVLLQIVSYPRHVKIVVGHKKTVPIVVFTAVMLAVIGLILVLENVRPRVRLRSAEEVRAPVAPALERQRALARKDAR